MYSSRNVLAAVAAVLGHQLLKADGFLQALPGRPSGARARAPRACNLDTQWRASRVMMGADEEERFPVLSRLVGGAWEGEMRYAAGPSLLAAPFVLHGTTNCVLEGRSVTLESSVTFPNGKTRTVVMQGKQEGEAGGSIRLDPLGTANSPIYMQLAELAPDTVNTHTHTHTHTHTRTHIHKHPPLPPQHTQTHTLCL
jgi:hypothetical protein